MAKKRNTTITLSSIRERIRRYQEDVKRYEDRVSDLKTKIAALTDLVEPDQNGNRRASSKEGPKAAIMRVVAASPGIKPADVVAQVVDTVKTGAKDPRKSLFQTILNLKNSGALKATNDGSLEIGGRQTDLL